MKTIDSWTALQPYGIVPLTNEPDGLRYRIVCDVTAKGKSLVAKTLGVVDIQMERNWDYGTNAEPHVGSMTLSPEFLTIIGVYALLDDGCHEVWMTNTCVLVGIQHGDSQQTVADLQRWYGNNVTCRFICPEPVFNWNPAVIS